ncbi:histidine phosphatase family protein [Paraburkholderia bengalensis]|uniref:Histidine phosphatase family protein n=1 Tax=Paraburkholderia bengalensis TaxID=2747562 RepID=A0ABU8IPS4_9BURK
MRIRLLMISHPATAAQRKGTFPDGDDPLDARAVEEAAACRAANADWLAAEAAFASPARCATEAARIFGFAAVTREPALADADYGRWRGRRLVDIARDEPDALAVWTRDPSAAPHGGESFDALTRRVGGWLDALSEHGHRGTLIAVTHAPVIRAVLVHVLHAPSTAFTQIDVPPLAIVELQRGERGWTWRATAPHASPHAPPHAPPRTPFPTPDA